MAAVLWENSRLERNIDNAVAGLQHEFYVPLETFPKQEVKILYIQFFNWLKLNQSLLQNLGCSWGVHQTSAI